MKITYHNQFTIYGEYQMYFQIRGNGVIVI